MRIEFNIQLKKIVVAVCLVASVVSIAAAQANPYLDIKNWSGSVMQPGGRGLKVNPEGIVKDGTGLKMAGFHLGREAQYSLNTDLAKNFEDKLVTLTVKLDGEFVAADASFLAFVQRGSSPNSIFWSQPCYALLFKADKIEVQKHGKGTNPNLTYKYSDFPAVGFKAFPIGKPVKVSYGIIKKGSFPTMIVKINGVEICSVVDSRYGQTVRPAPNNVFMISIIATNKEVSGDLATRSSLTVSNIEVE